MPSPVAFLIPALNEQDSIGPTLDALRSVFPLARCQDSEILVIDNGSTDATPSLAAQHGARVILEPRRGYGQACLAGIAALPSHIEIVVFLDADGSDDPSDLPQLLAPVLNNQSDLVLGSRILAAHKSGAFTPQQSFGNWLATRLMKLFFRANYTDLGPFRVIRRESLLHLNMQDTNYGWTIEMQIKAHRQRLRILELPVNYRRRFAGQSKISGNLLGTLRAGYKILFTLAKYGLSPNP